MSLAPPLPPAFIVGTGRCGSTLLSSFLRDHPAVLSLSELFVFLTDLGGRIDQAFPEGPLSGRAFWRLLSTPHPRQTLMLRHDVMMDEALYRPGPGRRYTRESGVPALLATTLPHLFDAPEEVMDALAPFVQDGPAAPIGVHYRRLFDHLRARWGARLWVERSGGSLRIVPQLRRHFPDARFVHLVRGGPETALSMSRHLGFRMALVSTQLTEVLGVDPFESDDRSDAGDLPDDLARYLPECFDAAAFRGERTAPPLCGHYWSGELRAGLRALEGLGDGLLTLRYEDVLARPEAALGRLFRFLLPDQPLPDLSACAARIRRPRSDPAELPPETRRQLERACAPGQALLEALP